MRTRLIKKFEGDHNFDYEIYRQILNRFDISFFEIQLTECNLINMIDLSILHSDTVFDLIRSISISLEVTKPEILDDYYRFMDNLYLYTIMSDQYIYNIILNCLTASLVFFTAKNDGLVKQILLSLFKVVMGSEALDLKKLIVYKTFVLKKLKEFGAKDEEIRLLDQRTDFLDVN